MPRTIPRQIGFLKGHRAIKSRQLNAQRDGFFNALKNHPSSLTGPPFVQIIPPTGGGSTLLNNLYSVWHFNVDTSPTFPSDFGSFNLTESNILDVVPGLLGNAINIDSVLDGLEGPITFAVDASNQFTVSFWVNLSAISAFGSCDIIAKAGDNKGYILRVTNPTGDGVGLNYILFSGNGSSYDSIGAGFLFIIGDWHHVIFGRDTNKIYIRVSHTGAFNPLQEAAAATYQPANAFALFAPLAGHNTNLLLDEFISWNGRFLNATEQEALWNNGLGKAWPFS